MTLLMTPPTPSANGNGHAGHAVSFWENWFQHATPSQRQEALSLAVQQGLLVQHQLPKVANGVAPKPAAPKPEAAAATAATAGLAAFLAGLATRTEPLDVLVPADNITWHDLELDAVQQHAVLAALSTPDLFLLHGWPGTGKSRVLAELLTQAAGRGWRVVFLASHHAAVDVVLQRLVGRHQVLALRGLESDESPEQMPAWLRSFTFAGQKQAVLDRAVQGAQESRQKAEELCSQRQHEEPLWAELSELLVKHEAVRAQQTQLHQQTAAIADEHERAIADPADTSPVALQWRQAEQAHAAGLAELTAQRQATQLRLAERDNEIAAVRDKLAALDADCQAKLHGQWWTPGYWSATITGKLAARDALLAQLATLEKAPLDDPHASHLEREQQLAQQRDAEQARAKQTEADRRHATHAQQIRSLEADAAQLRQRWDALVATIPVAEHRPVSLDRESLHPARKHWESRQHHEQECCRFARQWAGYLEESGRSLAESFLDHANVHVGTHAALLSDRRLQQAVAAPLDLLILEDADSLTESDLAKLTRTTRRCVLVGNACTESAPPVADTDKSPRGRNGLHSLAPRCWPRLWQALEGHATPLPYRWLRDGERLVCQLLPLRPDEVARLHCEGLADQDEIELRFLRQSRGPTRLAQLVFPASQSLEQAFHFVASELDETPLAPGARSLCWSEQPDSWLVRTSPSTESPSDWTTLELGLRLGWNAGPGPGELHVACFYFEKTHWTKPLAAAWLSRRLQRVVTGRAVSLQTPHRLAAPLARFAGSVLFPHDVRPRACDSTDPCVVEMVAVPALRGAAWPKEGAGLEQDLATHRLADRLPLELRPHLPPQGVVNYLEAQALVRRLEAFTQEPNTAAPGTLKVAVLAMQHAQAALLKHLIEQSPILASPWYALEIGTPAQMQQRECDVAFVSLTRSHAHRAVPFDDDPRGLALALTRARRTLLVFGDPGTLAKRSHWQGPLEHVAAAAASEEARRLARLVEHAQAAPV